ncbi:riboflavin kinase [Ophidiomyces ophidiicola]|uniref:Riboflavin kinase n=1 Tax=Ophidiomyces ophidiicola TaxID=1387563 RepID=A0ACB8V2N9_9EURO|nr:riboflavin kinase [Ophidiomyces ophidiicola]KAI1921026.1 riboflavin kinase [Ophidiomyces ophidiicola]KAI1961790.1 riboflavin kinase [Ophidiomyces ophidiicola]KAI2008884.1 riboflavin kinase [Ophidiomyces ophidiicola]KAI2020795.1 riboflavin kinase [Ophidiomyces ophidiicola]
MPPSTPREPIAGSDSGPETPFPIRLSGAVIKGFGRGSKEVCSLRLLPLFDCLYPINIVIFIDSLGKHCLEWADIRASATFNYRALYLKYEQFACTTSLRLFFIKISEPLITIFSILLGIPTANIPAEGLSEHPSLNSGVYYGVAALDPRKFEPSNTSDKETRIFPCVLSIGYNPFYKNTEIHILPHLSLESAPSVSPLASDSTDSTSNSNNNEIVDKPRHHFHHFPDFYGTPLNLLILGYIRPEYDYVSLEALVEDIRVDCEVAKRSLTRKTYVCFMRDDVDGPATDQHVEEAKRWLRTFT